MIRINFCRIEMIREEIIELYEKVKDEPKGTIVILKLKGVID